MEFITVLVFFLLISSGSIFASTYFKTKYEEVLPITCTFIVLLSFLFGIIGILKYSVYLVIIFSIVIYVLSIIKIKKENNIKEILNKTFTPGFALFVVLFIVFLIAIYGKLFDAWDEFSHWGDIVKVMSTLDDFGTNPASQSMFKTYPPGMSLFQYFLEKLNYIFTKEVFVEWIAYFSYYTLAVSYIVPIASKLTFKKPLQLLAISGAVMCIPFTFYNGVYYQLYIDPFLSFLVCSGLIQLLYNNKNDKLSNINFYCVISMLVLAKDAGLAFAICLLIAYIIENLINHKFNKYSIKNIFISIFALLIPKLLWTYNISKYNAKDNFGNKYDFINLFQVIIGKDDSYRAQVLKNFINGLSNYGAILNNFNITVNYNILFLIIIVLLFIVIKFSKTSKLNKKITYIVSILSLIIFVFGMCLSYMYKFSEVEALGLASFDRYMNIIYMGLFLFIALVAIIDVCGVKNEIIISLGIILTMCICAPVQIMLAWMYRSTVRASYAIREPYEEIVNKTLNVTDGNDEVWFIAQETQGLERLIFKYSIRPNYNDAWWSIGEPFYDGDDYTELKTSDEWKEELMNDFDYVAIYSLNEYFYDNFSEVFNNPKDIGENRVYKVDKNTGLLTLCE